MFQGNCDRMIGKHDLCCSQFQPIKICVFFTRIDLIMEVEAILMSRQICLEVKCLHGNPMSNNFHKTLLLKFHELETIDSRKRILSTKYE